MNDMSIKIGKSQEGFSLLELVLAIAIFSLGAMAAGYMMINASIVSRQGLENAEAVSIAREGIEAVTSMRDSGFSLLTDGSHGLLLSGGYAWSFTGTSSLATSNTKFRQSISIMNYNPDVTLSTRSYAIVTSTVTWTGASNKADSVSLVTILTNWRNQ